MLSEKKDKDFLSQFIAKKDVPSWFRGTSPFQIEAADQLSTSIRDDIEQETCHRVCHCLTRLGLVPSVPHRDLKILMKLSGGNDLAFLWFLMELYYKTPGDKYNSLNEQVILSSIAHLDMVTTLRELDRILPPGHASKRQLEQRRKRLQRNKSWHMLPHENPKKQSSSPYFDRLERPVPYGKPLDLERPDYKVRFFRYDIYKDPNYMPPNEQNRWYANYFLNKAKRISTKTVRDYLNELMEVIGLLPSTIEDATTFIDLALEGMTDLKHGRTLCKKHELEEEERRFRREQQAVEHRQKCLKSLEIFPKQKQARLEKIHTMLENNVAMYRLQYRHKLRDHLGDRTYIRLLGKDDYSEYLIDDDKGGECIEMHPCKKSASTATLKRFQDESANISMHSNEFKSLYNAVKLYPKNHRPSFGQTEHEFNNLYYGNLETPPSSQRYFVAPTKDKPYHFDYPKIFHYKDKEDERTFIKEKCVDALDEAPKHVPKMVDFTPDLGKLSKKCADEIWQEKLKEWNVASEASKSTELPRGVTDPYPADMPRLPFYDCEDKKLMDDMLRIALHEMSKHPKFVLASLPNAHKLPLLREWIYQRYGKRYTHAQRVAELNNSIKIMNTLLKLKLQAILPEPTAIGAKFNQNYGCHK
ncbi:uncharacterized protein LOC118745237 [Rhagoletis pomonella]|uniref:uncharacterized protein LOC118745237 n=1 Tax=Rhagoletis pomonella TaxID=28610 RepID=UPI0017859FAA|nr:uncharacterized protein LOC118745237 [Rhagoletis pomonella]